MGRAISLTSLFAWALVLVGLAGWPPPASALLDPASHSQTCQGNDDDDNLTTPTSGTLCAFASVRWLVPGVVGLSSGAHISEATGFTWVFLQIVGELVLDGTAVSGTVHPGSGDAVEFITGDEDYPLGCPDLVPCAPYYAGGGATDNCVVATSDSGDGVTEFNSNIAGDTEEVAASYTLTDAARTLLGTPSTGTLYLDEGQVFPFIPLPPLPRQQTQFWVSDVLEAAVPGTAHPVTIEVAFDSIDYCDARGPEAVVIPPSTPPSPWLGSAVPVRWDGDIEDRVVYG